MENAVKRAVSYQAENGGHLRDINSSNAFVKNI